MKFCSPGLAGMMIAAALGLTGTMNTIVQVAAEVEKVMASVERVLAYSNDHETEAPAILEGSRPPIDWPQEGAIELRGLAVRYRADLPLVLKGLTLGIRAREKVRVFLGQTYLRRSILSSAARHRWACAGGRGAASRR